jgi:glycine oxidase
MTHIVIGGGIMGLLTAHYLNAAGEKVIVVEQGKLGRESSWAGGGILSPLYPWRYPDALNQLATWSQLHYPALIEQLKSASDIDAQWIQSGMMVIDPEEIKAATDWAKTQDIPIHILHAQEISRYIPNISDKALREQAMWMPQIAQVRNPRLLKALIQSLQNNGVALLEDTPVTQLCIENDTVVGVQSQNKIIHGASVTVACGAWSSRVLQKWLPDLNVEPVRGQMILYKANPDTLSPIILKDSHYLIPRKDGRIIVGSTLEFVGFDKNTTVEAREELINFAVDLLPSLENYPVEHHWSGLRPGNSVQIPFISSHPDVKGLFVNTGHYRNGVVTAPASAALCVDLILSRSPILDTKPYAI